MTTMREYRCEICGIVDTRPVHWFVIQCGDSQLSVDRWTSGAAEADGPGTSAVKPTPRRTSADGLIRYARHLNPISTLLRQRDEVTIVRLTKVNAVN